jgi:hypothetical protein
VPDLHRLCVIKPPAPPCQIVGEDLHRVVLVRLVAPSMSAQVHGHDAVARRARCSSWGTKQAWSPGGGPPAHQHEFAEWFDVLEGELRISGERDAPGSATGR